MIRDAEAIRMHDDRILYAVAYSHIYTQWNADRTAIERVRVVPASGKPEPETGERKGFRMPRTVTVFHISQTEVQA